MFYVKYSCLVEANLAALRCFLLVSLYEALTHAALSLTSQAFPRLLEAPPIQGVFCCPLDSGLMTRLSIIGKWARFESSVLPELKTEGEKVPHHMFILDFCVLSI